MKDLHVSPTSNPLTKSVIQQKENQIIFVLKKS